jgi:choice-of-anchor B domain-containing protein
MVIRHTVLSIFFVAISCLCGAQISFNVDLLYNWHDTSLALNYRDSRYNDVWGIEKSGREYAVIGSTFGTHFLDVTDPSNTYEVDRVPGKVQGSGLNHRDFHSFGNFLYGVCDQGDGSLQIIDLQYLPDSVHLVYNQDSLLIRAHNVFVDTSSALLYACATTHNDNSTYGMEVFDVSNPVDPQLVYTHAGNYIHDVYARNDTVFMHAAIDGMLIYDFTIENAPTPLGALPSYPFQGYNHSGWLNKQGDVYVFADENYGLPLKVCDVSDFSNIQVLSTFSSAVSDSSIAHNIMIKGNYAYCSYYNDGLQIFDISDPSNPFKVGWYDTFPSAQKDDYRGAWGIYAFLPSGRILISDRNTGLYVLDVNQALSLNAPLETTLEVKVIQNPSNDPFIFQGNMDIQFVKVYDLNGQLVQAKPIAQRAVFVLDPLPSGMFFVHITTKSQKIIKKIVSL